MLETVCQDEKVAKVLEMLQEGFRRDDIGDYYEQQWKSVDIYMRRKGFRWCREQQTYILKEGEPETKLEEAIQTINTKAAQVVRMLDVKHPNIRQTAAKQGFASIEDMGEYMRSQGYIWDDELSNYQYDEASKPVVSEVLASITLPVGALDEEAILQLLVRHQEKLLHLLQSEQVGSLHTYRFKGNKVNKTLTLASSAAALLEDYQKEYNITQRSIVETALAEFFERHGYDEQLRLATT
ncbi:hypothetical protein JTI58_12165 [Lysinibacillus fusiformis]|uniref:hypothetical protein n=1 Tax=Lysinibacillus fusiformis TaxID=28031 RepID=UPI001966E405|nr:hypothetical protein [Lysinibacillus fusiformis]QSB12312.1 hypothetical protein JTI58_12165 [Lysinibacillus fusiformis]